MFPKWVMVTIPILHHRGGGGSWDQPATFVCPPPPAPTRFCQTNRSRISRFLSSHQPAGDLLYERRHQEARVGGGGDEGSRIIPIQIETCDKTSSYLITGSSDGMHRCRHKSAATRKIEIVIESQSNRRSDLPSSSSSWERHPLPRPTARSLSCGTVGASPLQPSKALSAWSFHSLCNRHNKALVASSHHELVRSLFLFSQGLAQPYLENGGPEERKVFSIHRQAGWVKSEAKHHRPGWHTAQDDNKANHGFATPLAQKCGDSHFPIRKTLLHPPNVLPPLSTNYSKINSTINANPSYTKFLHASSSEKSAMLKTTTIHCGTYCTAK